MKCHPQRELRISIHQTRVAVIAFDVDTPRAPELPPQALGFSIETRLLERIHRVERDPLGALFKAGRCLC